MRHAFASFAAFATLAATGCGLGRLLPPELPPATRVERVVSLQQGWDEDARRWFHHASQGSDTLVVPYEWFLALEQPELSLGESPLLSDPEYLARFGFVPGERSSENPGGLPVGFAVDPDYVDPLDGRAKTALGFTCAACHTGQLEYEGARIVVEGGPAMTDLGKFRSALALAVLYTKWLPFRFGRFAERSLGEARTPEAEDELERALDEFIAAARENPELRSDVVAASTEEGFTRLDALGRIGNFVFGAELDPANVVPLRAPVNFPHIWGTPWFDWVQYDGSIHQPMVRNAGEALGVRAAVNLRGPEADRFRSTARVRTLYELERTIAGPAPLQGLRAPRWPSEIFGEIDEAQAARGAQLYTELCQRCHLPPVGSAEFLADRHWSRPNGAGQRYLEVRMIPVANVGTDDEQARAMVERMVETGPLGLGRISFGQALAAVVERTVERWYDEQAPPVPPGDRDRMNGHRPNLIRAELAYKARPLDGVWATAPYLHNGSVPNLYLLLSPVEERPREFWLGSRSFDPVDVGFEHGELDGGFRLRTEEPGNSNGGHEFRGPPDGPLGSGVVGRALAPDERRALIEFLKTQ